MKGLVCVVGAGLLAGCVAPYDDSARYYDRGSVYVPPYPSIYQPPAYQPPVEYSRPVPPNQLDPTPIPEFAPELAPELAPGSRPEPKQEPLELAPPPVPEAAAPAPERDSLPPPVSAPGPVQGPVQAGPGSNEPLQGFRPMRGQTRPGL